MRQLIIAISCLLSSAAHAVQIDINGYNFVAVATQMYSSASLLDNVNSPDEALTDLYASSYAYSPDENAQIDLWFGDGIEDHIHIGNGAGNDLSIFFVSSGGHSIGLDIFSGNTLLGSESFDEVSYTGYCIDDGSGVCEEGSLHDLPIFVMDINFDAFGAGITAIDRIRINTSMASAVPSLAGAYYLEESLVIPVPPAIMLFASGLGLLGFVSRRRRGSRQSL